MRGVTLVRSAVLLLVCATVGANPVSLYDCDGKKTGPPTVSAVTLGPDVTGRDLILAGDKLLFFTSRAGASPFSGSRKGALYITQCDVDDPNKCVEYDARYIDNGRDVSDIDLAIASTTALVAPTRQYVLFQAFVEQRVRGFGADIMRCDLTNLTRCEFVDVARKLYPAATAQLVSVSLDLLAKGRVFATMRNVSTTQGSTTRRVTCALSPNSEYVSSHDILSDCKDLPMLPSDAAGQNFMLAAFRHNLYAAVEYTSNQGLTIPTIVKCPFNLLSLTAPSCQRFTLPVPPDYLGWSSFVEGEQLYSSAVYKGRFFMIISADGPAGPDRAQSRQAYIASCGGQQFECKLYKAPRNNTLVGVGRFNGFDGYYPTQLKVYNSGLFLWPADPSPAKWELTECKLPWKHPSKWFTSSTCKVYDVGTLANVEQDVYNLFVPPFEDFQSRSRLFFSSVVGKFIAGFSVHAGLKGYSNSYVIYTGLPCKTLPRGCRARNNTCAGLNFECGTGLDACGRVVNCGSCDGKQPTPYTKLFCGGARSPNHCGCFEQFECSDVCAREQHQCSSSAYPVRDTCGRDCDCGTCRSGFTCRKSLEEGDRRRRCYRTCNLDAPQYGAPGSCNHHGRCRRDGRQSICDNTCGPPLFEKHCFWLYNPNNTEIGCCISLTSTFGTCGLDCPGNGPRPAGAE